MALSASVLVRPILESVFTNLDRIRSIIIPSSPPVTSSSSSTTHSLISLPCESKKSKISSALERPFRTGVVLVNGLMPHSFKAVISWAFAPSNCLQDELRMSSAPVLSMTLLRCAMDSWLKRCSLLSWPFLNSTTRGCNTPSTSRNTAHSIRAMRAGTSSAQTLSPFLYKILIECLRTASPTSMIMTMRRFTLVRSIP
jgi:hypothetical protein